MYTEQSSVKLSVKRLLTDIREKSSADIINMTYSCHVELDMICMECEKL